MGITAEKLKYLNETKAEIKNALETPYNVMRDYPELIKKYIDNQPTKVVTDGICGNAVDVPVKAIEINGNIRQETTEGYNILQNIVHKNDENYTTNGITFTKNSDGSIVANGTAIANAKYYFVSESGTRENIKSGVYRITGCPSGGSASSYRIIIGITEIGEKYENGNGVNITISSDNTYYFAIFISGGQTVSDLVFKPMIVSGTEDKPYEPYTGGIPSPNPDYPQEIESVDGYNMIDKIIEKSRAWGNGAIGDYPTMSRTDYIEVKPNTTYYASHSMNGGVAYSIWFYDKDKQAISPFSFEGKGTDSDAFDKSGIFTTPSNAKYLIINYLTATIKTTPPVLVEGTNSKPYLPYGCIGLKQSGKNRIDFINYAEKVFDSSKVEKLSDGSYKFKHCDTVYTLFEGLLKAPCTLSCYARNDGTETTLRPTFIFKIFYEDGTVDASNYTTSPGFSLKTKVLTKNVIKIVNSYIGTSPLTIIKDAQLEEGSKATSYEPYHEPIITTINLQGNILSKVGDVKDILRVNRNGKVEIKKNIGKVVLDGTENWDTLAAQKGNNTSFFYYIKPDMKRPSSMICNQFINRAVWSTDVEGIQSVTNNAIKLRINTSRASTVSKLKAWLVAQKEAGTPVILYYELATPQIITLLSISPIELWQGTNIFKLITNLDTDSEVEYIVDKDSVLNEVQTAMLEAEI